MVKGFWAKSETEYLGFIDGSGNVRTPLSKVATVKNWALAENAKNMLSILSLSVRFIVNSFTIFADCSVPWTDLCRKSLPGRLVYSDTTRVVFETLKARMISAPELLIPKSG